MGVGDGIEVIVQYMWNIYDEYINIGECGVSMWSDKKDLEKDTGDGYIIL